MLQTFVRDANRLVVTSADPAIKPDIQARPVWFDLHNPTRDEAKLVENGIGISLPTREEMQDIEVSARLYRENGAEFVTITAISQLDTEEPETTPLSFVIAGNALVTVRYAEPKAFSNFAVRATKPNAPSCANGEQIMIGLIEALLDRMADALERIASDIDRISRSIFRKKGKAKASNTTADLQAVIEKIGRDGDLLTMIRESLVSINRALAYHTTSEDQDKTLTKEARARVKVLQRDVIALTDQTMFLNAKINFLLDATLGLINLQQNQIIKIFTIATVAFLPPTMVATVYGMNFKHIPELDWQYGYPWSIMLMIVSAVLPYIYFKRRGWL